MPNQLFGDYVIILIMWTHCELDFFFDLRQQQFYWTFCISVDQLVRIRKFLNLNFDSVFFLIREKRKFYLKFTETFLMSYQFATECLITVIKTLNNNKLYGKIYLLKK